MLCPVCFDKPVDSLSIPHHFREIYMSIRLRRDDSFHHRNQQQEEARLEN